MSDSPKYYLLFELTISIISIPINLFTLYCIVKKSSLEMKEYKVPLTCAQLFTLTLDLILFTIKPELNFPAISGRIFGIWDSVFGLGASSALATGSFLVVSTLSSLLNIYFLKLQSLLEPTSFFKFNRLGKVLFMSPLFIFYPLLIAGSIAMMPIQKGINTDNLRELLQTHPFFSYLANYSDIYVGRIVPIYPPFIELSAIHVFCVGVLIYAIHAISYTWIFIGWCQYVITNCCPNMSAKTRKMQRKLLTAMSLETTISTLSLGVPWIYYAIIIFIQANAIYQTVNNFFFGLLCSHGALGSIFWLILIEPFRRFTITVILKTPTLNYFGKFFFTTQVKQLTIIHVSNFNSD